MRDTVKTSIKVLKELKRCKDEGKILVSRQDVGNQLVGLEPNEVDTKPVRYAQSKKYRWFTDNDINRGLVYVNGIQITRDNINDYMIVNRYRRSNTYGYVYYYGTKESTIYYKPKYLYDTDRLIKIFKDRLIGALYTYKNNNSEYGKMLETILQGE